MKCSFHALLLFDTLFRSSSLIFFPFLGFWTQFFVVLSHSKLRQCLMIFFFFFPLEFPLSMQTWLLKVCNCESVDQTVRGSLESGKTGKGTGYSEEWEWLVEMKHRERERTSISKETVCFDVRGVQPSICRRWAHVLSWMSMSPNP